MSEHVEDLDALFDQVAQSTSQLGTVVTHPAVDLPVKESVKKGQEIYSRLGALVRELHEALKELGYDRTLDSTLREVVDSKDRLEYIASLTEKAANSVLNAVDEGLPVQDAQLSQAKNLEDRWADMFAGKLNIDEFKILAADARDFSSLIAENSKLEKKRLMDIMMAQDFQDITGQIIKKVVALSKNLECELAQILVEYAPEVVVDKSFDLLAGPATPENALAQDDVDKLLDDLGF